MQLKVCLSCDAEFKIKHNMDGTYYRVESCPFCGDKVDEELEDESLKEFDLKEITLARA